MGDYNMKRIDILDKLVRLSHDHLMVVIEENWDRWENIAGKKIELYNILLNKCKPPYSKKEEILINEVDRLEKESSIILRQKRDETRAQLNKVGIIKKVFRGYKYARKANINRPHISFEV